MFKFMKRHKTVIADDDQYHREAAQIAESIARQERQLDSHPQDGEIQKQLMLEYNRALKIYAKSKAYRDRVDELFVKIDELRNVIRKSV